VINIQQMMFPPTQLAHVNLRRPRSWKNQRKKVRSPKRFSTPSVFQPMNCVGSEELKPRTRTMAHAMFIRRPNQAVAPATFQTEIAYAATLSSGRIFAR
jgi:hypothetical protein